MKRIISRIVWLRNMVYFKYYNLVAKINSNKLPVNEKSDLIVSIASYPQRDHHLPAVFECLRKQNYLPKKYILVLSIEEYDKNNLPKHISKIVSKGIEIVWSVNNPFAVKTLVPVLIKYPDENILALDDDLLYYDSVFTKMHKMYNKYPNCILGFAGKELYRKGDEINMYFRRSVYSNINSDPNTVYFLKGYGTLYPAGSIHQKALNLKKIHELVPGRGADMWFWAAAHAQDTKQVCIGELDNYDVAIPIPENEETKSREMPSHEQMNERFQRVIDYYEIREKLIIRLPDIEEEK